MQTYYSAVSALGIASLLMLDHMARKSDLMAVAKKRFFRLSVWTAVAVMVAEVITILFGGTVAPIRFLNILGNVFGFALSPFIPLLIGCAIGGTDQKSLVFFSLPAALNLVLSICSVTFPLIFWVDAENTYTRGGAFWVYIVSYVAALLFLLLQTLSITKSYQNNNRALPILLFFFVGLGTTAQVVAPWMHLSWLCVSFALILYYIYCCDLLHQIDGLTGLLNRRTYEYNLHRADISDHTAVIIFDVDDFKSINDQYGHPFGDHCLIAVSACIKKVFFRLGLCFRIGGDEFCVIVRKKDRSRVEKAARRFLHEVELMRQTDSRLPLVSVGYAFAESSSESISSIVCKADKNMYLLKQQRKKGAEAAN